MSPETETLIELMGLQKLFVMDALFLINPELLGRKLMGVGIRVGDVHSDESVRKAIGELVAERAEYTAGAKCQD